MTKLMGKKLGDSHDETNFAKKDLPSNHRVVEEDGMMTMDHNPDRYVPASHLISWSFLPFWGGLADHLKTMVHRLNIHVDKDGTVKKVTHG